MKLAANIISRLTFKTCKVSYSPTHTKLIVNYIATNQGHPLYITQRRRQKEKQKEGLWWHVTNATDTSKSGCVRTWTRRRLSNAFVEELKAKGYDENGKFVHTDALRERRDVMDMLKLGRSIDLTGSLRLHGVEKLIAAKFETVKAEMRNLVDALVTSAVENALVGSNERKTQGGPRQLSPRHGATPQARLPQERKVAVSASSAASKGKPDSAVVQAAKDLFRMKPNASPTPASSAASKGKPDSAVVQAAKDLFRVKPNASPTPASAIPSPARNTPAWSRKMAAGPSPTRLKPQVAASKPAKRTLRPSRGLGET